MKVDVEIFHQFGPLLCVLMLQDVVVGLILTCVVQDLPLQLVVGLDTGRRIELFVIDRATVPMTVDPSLHLTAFE